MLQEGDPPLTTKMLKSKLDVLWPHLRNWTVVPLAKGFFEFKFHIIDDMRKIWALGAINLKPGVLRFYCWSKDFKHQHLVQSHVQVWIRLMHLPQDYWRPINLNEIASRIGTPSL